MTQFQDKLMKYCKIHSLGSPETDGILDEIVVIESKIDGANFRMRYLPEEDKLIFGSRNNQLPDDTNSEQWIAIKAYKKAFEEHKEAFIPNVIYFSECFDIETEILTSDGWKNYNDISEDEIVLTYNINKDCLEYQKIRAKVVYPYNGNMMHFKTSSIDLLVTPNHRILYSRYSTRKFRVNDAINLFTDAQIIFKVASRYLVNKNASEHSKNVLRLLAWIITEGNINNGAVKRICITQSYEKNIEKCNKIEDILNKLSISWSKTNHNDSGCYCYTINTEDSKEILEQFENENIKTIPKWILSDASYDDLVIFRDEMMLGDGTSNKNYPNSKGYFTKYKELADRFQELCIKTGWRCHIHIARKIDKLKVYDGFRLGINKKDYTSIEKNKKNIIKYNGIVWCVITDNTFIIVRRNGYPIITGNSMQKHTLSYENIPNTIGYDIFDVERNEFWNWKAAKQVFENIGIPFINVHYEGLLKDITQKQLKEYIKKSPYREEGDEGIVIKTYKRLNTYGRPLFAKIVDDVFKEKNKTVFKGQTPIVKTEDSKIVNEYFTEGRLIKAINHFKDDNEIIDMSLMPKLFKYISEDILSENILEIKNQYETINFKNFNNLIAKKSAKMLKEYLIKEVIKC